MNVNNVLIIALNLLDVYVIHRFMRIFFAKRDRSRTFAVAMYGLLFLGDVITFFCETNALTNLIISLINFLLITLCYESTWMKRIVAALMIYLCTLSSETILAIENSLNSFQVLESNDYYDAWIILKITVIELLITLLMQCFKNIKNNDYISKYFFIEVIGVFAASVVIGSMAFSQQDINNPMTLSVLFSILLIDAVLLYHYDSLSGMFEEQNRRVLAQQAEEYYHTQAEMIQTNDLELRRIRHDMKNHLVVLREMLEQNEIERISQYLDDLAHGIAYTKLYSQSGNIAVDSIVNYKMRAAEEEGITVTAEMSGLQDAGYEMDDLPILLGNLLDNAIEACRSLSGDRFIRLTVKSIGNRVEIHVENRIEAGWNQNRNGKGEGERKGKRTGVSARGKRDKNIRGYGWKNIQKTVEKHHGEMEIIEDEDICCVNIAIENDKR